MVHENVHWGGAGQIPLQGVPQDDWEETSERTGQSMGIYPAGGGDGGYGIEGCGYISLPPLEQSCTVYCDKAHYGPVSGSGEEALVKDGQLVAEAIHTRFGEDTDGGLGGGTDGGGRGYRRDRDRNGYGLSWWEDNVAQITVGAEPNNPLVYAPGLEPHHLIMSKPGENGGHLVINK